MSLGRPDRGSVENADRLFQILTGLYDELNGLKKGESVLRREIIQIGDELTTINVNIGSNARSSPAFPVLFDAEDDPGELVGQSPSVSTSLARVWLSTPDPSVPYGVNMGALGAGTLQQTVTAGVSTPTAFAGTAGSIPFYASNSQLAQDNANFMFDAATGDLRMGGGPWLSSGQKSIQLTRNFDGATHVVTTNSHTGTNVSAGFVMSLETAVATAPYAAFSLFGANYSIASLRNSILFDLGNSTGNIVFSNLASATGGIEFTTTGSRLQRMVITNGGAVGIGTSSPAAFAHVHASVNTNEFKSVVVANNSAGTAAQAGFSMLQNDGGSGSTMHFTLTGSGFTTAGNITAGTVVSQLGGGSGNMVFRLFQNTGDFVFQNTTSDSVRMRITNGGGVAINGTTPDTNAMFVAGHTTNTNRDRAAWFLGGGTDINSNAENTFFGLIMSGTTVPSGQTTGVWSTARIKGYTLTGTSTPNIAEATTLRIDAAPTLTTLTTTEADPYAVHVAAGLVRLDGDQAWNNAGGANYERVRAFWSANVWNVKSEKGGSGTVRAIKLDADTAALTLKGNAGLLIQSSTFTMTTETGGTGHNVTMVGNNGDGQFVIQSFDDITILNTHNMSLLLDDNRATLQGSPTLASAAGLILDAVKFIGGATVTGTTTIATATGFNHVVVPRPSIAKGDAGGLTVTHSASFYIANSPLPGTDVTITNPYALWVDDGAVRLDGNLGMFGAAPVGQQTSGANLTNNVTSGGTNDTIANFTDLTTYANDAATIRNDIYQLARKLKQINDGLRLFGFFT